MTSTTTGVTVCEAAEAPCSEASSVSLRRLLVALGVCVFAVGTAEYVVVGLLPAIAADLAVSVPRAGALVTVYAATIAVGGLAVTAATARLRRRPLLVVLMGVFAAGNVLAGLAPTFEVLLLARVISASAHATVFAAGLVLAARLAPPGRQGAVVARVAIGLNLATVLGVPVGTALGNSAGWRATFAALTVLGLAGAALLARAVPSAAGQPVGVAAELRALRSRPVLLAVAVTVAANSGAFAVFTYLAAMLRGLGGFTAGTVTVLLFVLGVGSLVGGLAGGWVSDLAPRAALPLILTGLAVISVALPVLVGNLAGAAAGVGVFGMALFAIVPALQSRVLTAAHAAPTLAVAGTVCAFQVANGIGSALGGQILGRGGSYVLLGAVAAAITLAAAVLAAAPHLRRHPPRRRTKPGDHGPLDK